MTRQLKELMHEATDRAAFTPDIDRLLTTGRRQTRSRRLLTVAAAAVSIAVVAGGTMFALDDTRGSTPAPAVRSTEGVGSSGLCTDNTGGGLDAWKWPAFLSVQDTFGTSTVRRSPENAQDDHLGVATIKAGYFAYRRVEKTPLPGPLPGSS